MTALSTQTYDSFRRAQISVIRSGVQAWFEPVLYFCTDLTYLAEKGFVIRQYIKLCKWKSRSSTVYDIFECKHPEMLIVLFLTVYIVQIVVACNLNS